MHGIILNAPPLDRFLLSSVMASPARNFPLAGVIDARQPDKRFVEYFLKAVTNEEHYVVDECSHSHSQIRALVMALLFLKLLLFQNLFLLKVIHSIGNTRCPMGMLLHCACTACTYRETHPRSPTTCLIVAQQSSKAHKIIMKLPSNRSVQSFCA